MRILVTGGASGLGKAIVEKLAAIESNTVYFTYFKSAESARKLEAVYRNVKGFECIFNESDSVSAFVDRIPELDVDILVNNANSGMHKGHFNNTSYQVYQDSFENNVLPVLRISQEVIKICRKKKFGKIINILSSALVNRPPVGWSEYVSNKEYLLGMNKAWATENIRFNITSNAVSPGFMQTSLTSDTDPRILEEMIKSHPLKKLLQPEEVAQVIQFFTTVSQQVNGVHFVMNAGVDIA